MRTPLRLPDPYALYSALKALKAGGGCVKEKSKEASILEDAGVRLSHKLGEWLCAQNLAEDALRLAERGYDVEKVAEALDWKGFEELLARYLEASGWVVVRNLRFGRREVDVVAADPVSRLGLSIDCKRWGGKWRKAYRIKEVAAEQRKRTEDMLSSCGSIASRDKPLTLAGQFVSVVVTLKESVRGYFGGSFVVPIFYFRDFVNNLETYTYLEGAEPHPLIRNPCA